MWELSPTEAKELLHAFLRIGQDGIDEWARTRSDLDYSKASVLQLLRETLDDIQRGLLNEEQTNIRFTRLGYYFGQALIRARPSLRWGTGNPVYAFANHPVVIGFPQDEEAPTITVCRNVVLAVAEGLSPPSRIEIGVQHWFGGEA